MAKIEISDFNENAYKKAIELAQKEIANLKANAEKLYQMNQTLRVANEEMKKYIDTHIPTEEQKASQKTDEKPFQDCFEECDGDCVECEIAEGHCVPDSEAVDIEMDHLIRENLDLIGRLKGMEDALHIAFAWLKYDLSNDVEDHK